MQWIIIEKYLIKWKAFTIKTLNRNYKIRDRKRRLKKKRIG